MSRLLNIGNAINAVSSKTLIQRTFSTTILVLARRKPDDIDGPELIMPGATPDPSLEPTSKATTTQTKSTEVEKKNAAMSKVIKRRSKNRSYKPLPERYWEDDKRELDYSFDDHTTPGHHYIRQVQYVRMFTRKAKFEAPKLIVHTKPFLPPPPTIYTKFLEIQHIGEKHALDSKVTLIVDLERLRKSGEFTPAQIHKLLLICQNHHKGDTLRFGSKDFDTIKQNQLHLATLWKRIKTEVKDGKDMFEDIPLPEAKTQAAYRKLTKAIRKFPSEWACSPSKVTADISLAP